MNYQVEIYTMSMVWNPVIDQVLLMNRPNHKGFPGILLLEER